MRSSSPYSYAFNNPLRFIDLGGLIPWPVNQTFNGHKRRHENNFGNPRTNHKGVDINLGSGNDDLGAPVYATHNGTITRIATIADDNNSGGNRIEVTSANGEVSTFYMHLDTFAEGLELGGTITEGQQIGTLGGSGFGKTDGHGAHLHYEMRVDGQVVNPAIDADNLIDPQKIINERNGVSNKSRPSGVSRATRASVSSQTDGNSSTNPSYWQQLSNQIREYFSITVNPNNGK